MITLARSPAKTQPPLSLVHFAADYDQPLVRDLIQKLKYEPFAKELASSLVMLIITYFKNLEKRPYFLNQKYGFHLIPIPLFQSRLKWRGFNQSEEIAKILAGYFEMPFLENALVRIKNTRPQTDLPKEERKENVKDAFACSHPERVIGKNVILFDDVYTTGATMREAAKVLKHAGAKEILGLTAARR